MKSELIRISKNTDGVFGTLLINKDPFCVTLEPEDLQNRPNLSCIPDGAYIVKRIVSPKYGDVFCVQDVPFRTHILIHSGNTEDDTLGCILLAQYYGKLKGKRAVLNSGDTMKDFMALTKGVNEFLLVIKSI